MEKHFINFIKESAISGVQTGIQKQLKRNLNFYPDFLVLP